MKQLKLPACQTQTGSFVVTLSLGRERVVAVGVLISYSSVSSMDYNFGMIINSNIPRNLYRFPLRFCSCSSSTVIITLYLPASKRMGCNVLILTHILFTSLQNCYSSAMRTFTRIRKRNYSFTTSANVVSILNFHLQFSFLKK